MNYPKPFRREGQTSLWFNYVDPVTGRRRLKSTGSSKVGESKEFIQNFMDRLTPAGTTTFREYATKFFSPETNPRYIRYKLAGKQYGLNNINSLRIIITKHVFKYPFADRPLSSITRGDILDLITHISKELDGHPATIDKVISYVSSIFSEAYYREDIKYNPAQRLTRIGYKKQAREIFTPQDIISLFKDKERWSSEVAYQVFLFAAYTGRRCGEVLGLQWEQINGEYCTIDRAYNRGERGLAEPKWGKCVTIPLCKTLLERLPAKGDCPYVFNINGKPLHTAWWQKMFRRNVSPYFEGNYVAHSFRHSLNTNLLLALMPPLYVKKYIGWADRSLDTQAEYTHIKPENLKFIADKIDEIYNLGEISLNSP